MTATEPAIIMTRRAFALTRPRHPERTRVATDRLSMYPASTAKLGAYGPRYSILIERALSEAARKAMEMEPSIQKLFTEAHRRSYDQGKAEGNAEGEAKALLMILKRRGLKITEQQQQIVACTDLGALERWLDRALSVASVEELFR